MRSPAKVLVRLLLSAVLLTAGPVSATLWVGNTDPPLRIGVLDTLHLGEMSSQQAIVLDRLRRSFHPRTVSLQYYDWSGLEHAVQSKALDLIICNAAFFSVIEHEKGVMALSGLVSPSAVDADHMVAGAVLAAKSASPLHWHDIRSHKLVLAEQAQDSNLAFLSEMYREGIRPEKHFESIQYLSIPVEGLLEEVRKDPHTVAVLPACTFEELLASKSIGENEFSVVNESLSGGLSCKRSTELFPGWVLASLPGVDLPTIHKVATTVLGTNTSGSLQWSFPPKQFTEIHNALIDLRIGPYSKPRLLQFKDFFYQYRLYFLLFFASILAIICHSLLSARTVRLRTADLKKALIEQQKMAAERDKAMAQIQQMERVQSVSQLSSLVAHELKQPLGSIRNFSRGLMRRFDKGNLDPQLVRSVLQDIIEQTDRAASIVDHVRSYAKNNSSDRKVVSLNALVHEALQTFNKTIQASAEISFKPASGPIFVEVNSWEIQYLLLNLLKNAEEQLKQQPLAGCIVVQTGLTAEDKCFIRVIDNGPPLDENALALFFKPMASTKPDGLGLGLTIAMCIAESHSGRIQASLNPKRGVTMEVILPITSNTGEQK